MNNGNKMTLKQKVWAKEFIRTHGKGSEAARIAGYSDPGQSAYDNKKLLEKNSEFIAMMDKAGLSDRKLLVPIKESLEANKSAIFEGEVHSSSEPDHAIRLKGAELAYKLRGRLTGNDEEKVSGESMQVLIVNYLDLSSNTPVLPVNP